MRNGRILAEDNPNDLLTRLAQPVRTSLFLLTFPEDLSLPVQTLEEVFLQLCTRDEQVDLNGINVSTPSIAKENPSSGSGSRSGEFDFCLVAILRRGTTTMHFSSVVSSRWRSVLNDCSLRAKSVNVFALIYKDFHLIRSNLGSDRISSSAKEN